jgi:mRNA interferase RelE/StbE
LSETFKIAETNTFSKSLKKDKSLNKIYKKITEHVYPILRINPYFGPNIKRLRGDLSEFYRYRIGDYRLFYQVDEQEVIIFIINLTHRKKSYK